MAMTKSVGFAVVGLGSISRTSILPAFAHSKEAKLVALVSRDQGKAAAWAQQFGAEASYGVENYSACLANPEVNAVYIATPPGDHLALAVRAAQAKKHVLCEKPLAATAEQSAQMVKACRSNNVLLMTAYRKYFEPSIVYLKQLIGEGALGKLDMIHTSFSELYVPGTSAAWMIDGKMAGGGPLMDLGVYCVEHEPLAGRRGSCGGYRVGLEPQRNVPRSGGRCYFSSAFSERAVAARKFDV